VTIFYDSSSVSFGICLSFLLFISKLEARYILLFEITEKNVFNMMDQLLLNRNNRVLWATTFLQYLFFFHIEVETSHFSILVKFRIFLLNFILGNKIPSTERSNSNQNSTCVRHIPLIITISLLIIVGLTFFFESYRRHNLQYKYKRNLNDVPSFEYDINNQE
jgi:hypothetical protein